MMADDESGVCSVFRSLTLTNPQFLLVLADTTQAPACNPANVVAHIVHVVGFIHGTESILDTTMLSWIQDPRVIDQQWTPVSIVESIQQGTGGNWPPLPPLRGGRLPLEIRQLGGRRRRLRKRVTRRRHVTRQRRQRQLPSSRRHYHHHHHGCRRRCRLHLRTHVIWWLRIVRRWRRRSSSRRCRRRRRLTRGCLPAAAATTTTTAVAAVGPPMPPATANACHMVAACCAAVAPPPQQQPLPAAAAADPSPPPAVAAAVAGCMNRLRQDWRHRLQKMKKDTSCSQMRSREQFLCENS